MDIPRKEMLFTDIVNMLAYDDRSWADFIVTDCQEFIGTLHEYRLEHLYKNIDYFIAYIDTLQNDYLTMLDDETLAPQAQATVQALFLLSCVEFASASKERMLIREMETVKS